MQHEKTPSLEKKQNYSTLTRLVLKNGKMPFWAHEKQEITKKVLVMKKNGSGLAGISRLR